MQSFFKYIIVVCFFFSITFAIERSKKDVSGKNSGVLVNLQEMLPDNENENTVERKRAHKRKRKVRPKRNGF